MEDQERAHLSEKILQVIRSLQDNPESWVDFARIGVPLADSGIQYKQYGFAKLRPFLNQFHDILEFQDKQEERKPPVCFVRPIGGSIKTKEIVHEEVKAAREMYNAPKSTKIPSKDSWLFTWAHIPDAQIKSLSELALDERWYYGESPSQGQEEFPILRNYLAYTFRRLCFENKVLIQEDSIRNEEYAAFNTGLVDKKYEYIYALFTKNRLPKQYWYLYAFVVAGEDKGKTLVSLFNPLPGRANYFENKIENMLYDTSTGELSCDYSHILTERTYRLPLEFLMENCGADFLCVEGVGIDEMYFKPLDEAKKSYFSKLGKKIKDNPRILKRLKNRMEDAVDLALKQVEWNYKAAIPMYFPTKNRGSLLLPLALVDEEHVDLALVVERQLSGAYQGQTVLPLDLAYSNSRLVARPDSDWLRTDMIVKNDGDYLDDNE